MDISNYVDTHKILKYCLIKDYNKTLLTLRTLINKEELNLEEKDILFSNLRLKKSYEVLFEHYLNKSERDELIQEI